MKSMTGYAYKEEVIKDVFVCVEIKSLNSRFLDINISLPPYLNSLESRIRTLLLEKIARGKLDVLIRIREDNVTGEVYADVKSAELYYDAIKKIARHLGKEEDVSLSLILSQAGVLSFEKRYDVEKYWDIIKNIFSKTLLEFDETRKNEGQNLYNDLSLKISTLFECLKIFKEWQPKMEGVFRENITQKFLEIGKSFVDENRIMSEVAALLVKYTINEEIVRLESHLESLRAELDNEKSGRRIDFLCQEINREINTIGSKNQSAELGKVVVKAKDALENIREQSKNVE